MRSFFCSRVLPFILLCLGTLLFSGCAGPLAPAPAQERFAPELNQLRQEQETLNQKVQRLQDNLLLLEARLHDQQQLLEELRRPPAPGMGTDAGQIAPPPQPVPAAPDTPQRSATETYLQAFADYAAARYPQAIRGFSQFLQSFPENDYAGNAQYWLAECRLAEQQLARAAEEFRRVAERYPDNSKAPDALLKLAGIQHRLGESGQAEQTLRLLRARYPESGAAKKSLQAP